MQSKITKSAEKLMVDIANKIRLWNERSNFTIKGVKNLSMSDLEIIKLYCQYYINYGSFEGRLMEPRGGVKEVLIKYDLPV